MNTEFSLGPIFPQIFFKKFGGRSFLNTPLGFIVSKQVYLDLSDLDLLNDLGRILDFYRELDFEGRSVNIRVPGYYTQPRYCECWDLIRNSRRNKKLFCFNCDKYICDLCQDYHPDCNITEFCMPRARACSCCADLSTEPIVYYKEVSSNIQTMVCLKCLNHVPHDPEYVLYTDPVINFNMAEWIPIKGFLENRNVNSDLCYRKIRYQLRGDIYHLNLIHQNVDYCLDEESTLCADAVWRVGEAYNVPEDLTNILFKYIEPLRYTCVDVNKDFPNIIIPDYHYF